MAIFPHPPVTLSAPLAAGGSGFVAFNTYTFPVASYNPTGTGTATALSTRFASLAAAQAVYPAVTSLTQTTDWAALQHACDLAEAAGGGDVIVSQPLVVGTTVEPGAGVRVVGTGGGSVTLAAGADTHVFTLVGAGAAVVGLTIDGNRANNTSGAAVNIAAADCLVGGCRITEVASDLGAVRLISGGIRAQVTGNWIADCDGDGVTADGNGAAVLQHDALIWGNTIERVADNGVNFANDVLRARIGANTIRDSSRIGIEVTAGCDDAVIDSNIVTMAADGEMAISVGACDQCVVTGNRTTGGTTYGIECHGSFNAVTSNVVIDAAGDGIVIPVSATVAASYNTVARNTIRSPGENGIRLAGTGATGVGNLIADNQIYDPTNEAIFTQVETDTTITGNQIWFVTAANTGIIAAGANAIVTNNRITYAAGIVTAAGAGIQRSGAAVAQIHDNVIIGNAKVLRGVHALAGNTSTSIRGNVIRGTTGDVILQAENSNTNTIEGNHFRTGGSGDPIDAGASVHVGRNYNEDLNRWVQGLFATATWDIPSLNDGDQNGATTVTVTGATLGAEVTVTLNQNLSGVRIWGAVTATNTVTLYANNETGGTVDPASGTVWVQVVNR